MYFFGLKRKNVFFLYLYLKRKYISNKYREITIHLLGVQYIMMFVIFLYSKYAKVIKTFNLIVLIFINILLINILTK